MYNSIDDFGDFYQGSNLSSELGADAGMGSMGGPYGMAAGVGLGLIKHVGDKRQHDRELQNRATQIRLAPFTGANIQQLANIGPAEGPWGNALAFGSAGAGVGQNFDKAANVAKLQGAHLGQMQSPQPMNYGTVFANDRTPGIDMMERPGYDPLNDNNMQQDYGPWRGYG